METDFDESYISPELVGASYLYSMLPKLKDLPYYGPEGPNIAKHKATCAKNRKNRKSKRK